MGEPGPWISIARAVQPGVDLAQVGGRSTAALGGRLAQGLFLGRGSQGPKGLHRVRIKATGGFDPLKVQAGLKVKLACEGLALIGLGAQPVHLQAVLVGLVAMRVDRGLAGTRLPDLGLRQGRGGAEQGQCGQDAKSDHVREDGACAGDIQAWPSVVAQVRRSHSRPTP